MMQDAKCVTEDFNRKEIDILFLKSNKNKANMDFPHFLHLLSEVALLLYKKSKGQNLRTLVEKNMLPLYDFIAN